MLLGLFLRSQSCLYELLFNDTSTLMSILCCLTEKGRKWTGELVNERTERNKRTKEKENNSAATEEILT